MTLMVYVYRRDDDGQQVDIPIPSTGGDPHLAGFESTRFTFYGSDEAKKLALRILPLLAEQSEVHVEGEELNELKNEVEILLKNLPTPNDCWLIRLNNILRAIEVAKVHATNACVAIS